MKTWTSGITFSVEKHIFENDIFMTMGMTNVNVMQGVWVVIITLYFLWSDSVENDLSLLYVIVGFIAHTYEQGIIVKSLSSCEICPQ